MEGIEKQFAAITSILLGRKLSGIRSYEKWLLRNIPGMPIMRPSKASEKPVYVPSLEFFTGMGGNVIQASEAIIHGEKSLSEADISCLSLSNAGKLLSPIKTSTPEIIWGENFGTEESACYGPTQNCFHVSFCWWSKYIAYSFWSRTSDSLFGCSNCTDCSFCIKCYSSTSLSRCFEVNDSNMCADSYFCHNCEGLRDCMFCFNTKNKSYAIGNVEMGREAYLLAKKLILQSVADELEKTNSLRYDIYNLCEGKRRG